MLKELFQEIIITGNSRLTRFTWRIYIDTINLVENQFPWMDMETEMLLGVTQIFLFTLYNERTRENKEKEGEKKRERKRKQKSARKCTFLSLPRKTIIHHYLDPVLPSLHTHIHRQESTQHKQVKFSGTKQHFAIAHSPWSGKR